MRYYDYLNAGLEIISTDIPRARDWANYLHIVGDAEGAVAAWRSLSANPKKHKACNWNYRENLWETRARELLKILAEILERKQTGVLDRKELPR
jgi:hypothetical protein